MSDTTGNMGKQYNKLIKRRRRTAYLTRVKSGQRSEENNSVKKASRNSMVKTGHKKSGINSKTQEKTSVVAEKASAEDVLGPESGVETKTRKSSKVESKD